MPITLIVLICLSVASLAVAAYVYLGERARREIVGRAADGSSREIAGTLVIRRPSRWQSLVQRGAVVVPEGWAANAKTEHALVQAGHDGPMAPLAYGLIRVALLVVLPLFVVLFVPKTSLNGFLLAVAASVIVALLLPMWYLVRAVRLRQDCIRRSLPDALDLLVVCIEAGISLDAAILRVAKDLGLPHPELASELLVVNRKTNAGMSRAEALRGLWTRTGVEEVRVLVTHIVQGERWGTSIGKILRVYSETLRRQRKQAAEKKASTAPVKMLFPLGVFIFPALLLVIMGPIILNVITLFKY